MNRKQHRQSCRRALQSLELNPEWSQAPTLNPPVVKKSLTNNYDAHTTSIDLHDPYELP